MRKIILIIGIIFFVAGVSFLAYPKIAEWFYNSDVISTEKNFKSDLKENTLLDDLYKELSVYNKKLFETGQAELKDPFSYSQPNFDISKYGLNDNIIGFIKIPKIEITMPIYLGANTANMKKGAVHLTQTSFPIGGNNTNAVIAAHRGSVTPMFRNIHKLEIGDKIIIENFKETLKYKVSIIQIISPTDIFELLIQPEKDMITLISCNPLGKNYQRLVVFCERT